MKEEYDPDCVTSSGVNQINPLNVNIIKVVTIVNKSEMENKTIIHVKEEACGTFEVDVEITMNFNTVK